MIPNETIHSLASSRNYTGDDVIDNVDNYVKERWRVNTVKDYEKLSEQYNKMLEERNSLIDDLSWYRAKVSRLEQRISKLVSENTKLQNDLFSEQLIQDEADDKIKKLERENDKYDKQFTDYIDETNVSLNLLSEISQHIGNKPSSSTYKYFRAKLDWLGIKEGE